MTLAKIRAYALTTLLLGGVMLGTGADGVSAAGGEHASAAVVGNLACGDCGVCWDGDTCPSSAQMHSRCGFECGAGYTACSQCSEMDPEQVTCVEPGDYDFFWICEVDS